MYRAINDHKAFTLVELVMVITIAGAMALVIVPLISRSYSARMLDSDHNQVISDLRWARQQALDTRTNCVVTFNTSNETYTITNQRLAKSIYSNIVSVSPSTAITFYFTGGADNTYTITLSNSDGRQHTITVTAATGHIS